MYVCSGKKPIVIEESDLDETDDEDDEDDDEGGEYVTDEEEVMQMVSKGSELYRIIFCVHVQMNFYSLNATANVHTNFLLTWIRVYLVPFRLM